MTVGARTRVLLASAAMAGLLGVAGCASEQEQWCERVEEEAPGLGRTIDSGGEERGLLDALPTLEALAEDAPDDVRDDWRTLVDALRELDDAVEAEDEKAIASASLRLASPDVQDAADSVEQQARDVCQTALF